MRFTTYWFIAVWVLIIVSCKKDNSDKEDNPVTIPGKISGKIIMPAGSSIDVNGLTVVSLGGVSKVQNGQYSIDTANSSFASQFVIDHNGKPLLMRYDFPGQTETNITPQTTALAMFMSFPLLQSLTVEGKKEILSKVTTTTEFTNLVNEISNVLKAGNSFTEGNNNSLNNALVALMAKARTLRRMDLMDEPIQVIRASRSVSLVNTGVAISYAVGLYKDGQRVGAIQMIGGYDLLPTSLTEAIAHIYALKTNSVVSEPSEVLYNLQGDGNFEIRLRSGKPGLGDASEEANKAFNYNLTKGAVGLISTYVPYIKGACAKNIVDLVASRVGTSYSLATADASSEWKITKILVDIAIAALSTVINKDLIQNCSGEVIDNSYFKALEAFLFYVNLIGTVNSTINLGAFAYHWYNARPIVDTCFSASGNVVTTCNTSQLIKGKWLGIESIERHFVNGNLVNTTSQSLAGVSITFSDNSYTVVETGNYPSTCTGTYSIPSNDNTKILMTGCDLAGQHSLQTLTNTALEILGQPDGTANDYSQTTLRLRK